MEEPKPLGDEDYGELWEETFGGPQPAPPLTLPRAILWAYNQIPEHIATDPEYAEALTEIEEYLERSGLGGEMK